MLTNNKQVNGKAMRYQQQKINFVTKFYINVHVNVKCSYSNLDNMITQCCS